EAEQAGYTVVDASAVLATHLTEIIRRHAADLLGRQETKALLDQIKQDYPAVVDELLPELLSVGEIQRVLQNLLAEGVPIRNLVVILETLADAARVHRDIDVLTEAVRTGLAPQISQLYADEDGVLPVLTLNPALEEELREAVGDDGTLAWAPARVQLFIEQLAAAWEAGMARGRPPVLLCPPPLRRAVRQITARSLPRLAVLSYDELDKTGEGRAGGVGAWSQANEALRRGHHAAGGGHGQGRLRRRRGHPAHQAVPARGTFRPVRRAPGGSHRGGGAGRPPHVPHQGAARGGAAVAGPGDDGRRAADAAGG